MHRILTATIAVALVALCLAPAASAEQKETEHVSKVVPISQDGMLRVKNFSGRVTITAADRNDIAIEAVRRATRERLDHIKLDIQATGKTVEIEANRRDENWSEKNNNVVETDFDIQVPRELDLKIHVFSSPVDITGVQGDLDVESFSGRLVLTDTKGRLELKTFSGNIRVGAGDAGDSPAIEAETFSGDIEAAVAPTASADVDFSTFSGDINSDLPLTLKSKSKRSLRATLNHGAANALRFTTFSGDVRLVESK